MKTHATLLSLVAALVLIGTGCFSAPVEFGSDVLDEPITGHVDFLVELHARIDRAEAILGFPVCEDCAVEEIEEHDVQTIIVALDSIMELDELQTHFSTVISAAGYINSDPWVKFDSGALDDTPVIYTTFAQYERDDQHLGIAIYDNEQRRSIVMQLRPKNK